LIKQQKYLAPPQEFDKKRLNYLLNGFLEFVIVLAVVCGGWYLKFYDPAFILHYFGDIIVTGQITAAVMCTFLYFKGLVVGGNPSGNLIIDYFYGYEVNPRYSVLN
jgi:hypothetical protein